MREGELLETVPGMIVTQHSGDGKANQYFVRGFNLDHGTDFQTSLDGMPVNMPSHAHGQGYTDLNFLIPELVDHIDYRLGVYYPQVGDFGSAGSGGVSSCSSALARPFVIDRSAGRTDLGAALGSRRVHAARRRRPASAAGEAKIVRRAVGRGRETQEAERRRTLFVDERSVQLLGDGDGLPQSLGFQRPDSAARRRRWT